MNWNALSAIGTILAAVVGIIGIMQNIYEKKRKLLVKFEMIPNNRIRICNNSMRSVAIIKMTFFINASPFYSKCFEGLHELIIEPAKMETIDVDEHEVYDSFRDTKLDALYNPNEKMTIVLEDNYGRQYRIKLEFGIAAFRYERKEGDTP